MALNYTAPSGTTYTQVNDSTYNWANGSKSGTVHTNPVSGPYVTYMQYVGAGNVPEEKIIQDNEIKNQHLSNVKNGTFIPEKSTWTQLREVVVPMWNKFINKASQKLTIKEQEGGSLNYLYYLKSGGGIHIKPENKGKFTDYCGGKVTEECIQRGKHSPSVAVRKRANFAAVSRKWKH